MNPVEMRKGYSAYHCLTLAKEMGLTNVQGYFLMADDAIFNIWQKIDHSTVHHSTGVNLEQSDLFWDLDVGIFAARNVVKMFESSKDPKIQNAWKQFQNGLEINGNKKLAKQEMTSYRGRTYSDFFYIPSSESDYYATLMRVFFENGLYLEIAVDKFMKSVKAQESPKTVYIWNDDREKWDEKYSKTMIGFHAVKLSQFQHPGKNRTRYIVICLNMQKVFTFFTTTLLFVFLIPFCFLLMSYSQYLSPCCSFMYDQEYLSYSYFTNGTIPNYSNTFVDLPLNTSSSVISIICYVLIFWKIHHYSPATVSVGGGRQKVRRNRDIRCAIQFSLLLAFYTFAWVLFRVLPIILATKDVEWFILVPTLYTLNCTSNAIIYICFNGEVQENLIPYKLHKILELFHLVRSPTPKVNQSLATLPENSRTTTVQSSNTPARFIPARSHQPFRTIRLNNQNSN
ncbi:hypothetical protein B9Z55_018268 [Caenorhabditis nigoni]|uniref:7TM GPCR serpentine receptor class x (Srx) domain-containing protein n=1 Tax=Caenorhabditis nigoni TaxID=1611254 RepID=A0A2G5TD45_9PELO|nr:hypothetical protein B9Z55_018268 [Caenorhabditis nigoni]